MSRAIISVGTGPYAKGVERLMRSLPFENFISWMDSLSPESPAHQHVPYAFKAFALKHASKVHDVLLWCDACIVPGARPLEELWQKIERDGIWFSNNGYTNYEWTALKSYPDLFPDIYCKCHPGESTAIAIGTNRTIKHVVATAFGINLNHPKGDAFLKEYLRLAKTRAFCGPWVNSNHVGHNVTPNSVPPRVAPCGPPDVRGHRHDQTAASVIAWRLGVELTNAPEWFAYKGGETDKTCLVADGNY